MPTALIFTIIITLIGSALFSGIEAALFSVSLTKAKILAEQKKKGAESLVLIKKNMRPPITVIVIFNNAFNIVGSIVVGVLGARTMQSTSIGVISGILTFLIILFGEIIPKSIGENYAVPISLIVSKPLLITTQIFTPIILLIEKLTKPFIKEKQIVSEQEIKILSHLGHLEGAIEEDEKEMIQRVFRLNDLTAKDIMTPRPVIEGLQANKSLKDLEEKIYSLSHSRLPIYKKDLDNIVGICHQRDLLIALGKDQKDKKIADFKQKVIFVDENMRVDDLLVLFQKLRTHLAVVKNEFGTTIGVVTLEDVLEQLVGEIVDETDKEISMRAKAKKQRKFLFEQSRRK